MVSWLKWQLMFLARWVCFLLRWSPSKEFVSLIFQGKNWLGNLCNCRVICLGGMTIVDRIMYGEWTFVIANFFKFNFLTAGGAFFGTHPWHWYFTQGLPAMAFTFLPPAVAGVWWSKQWALAGLVAWVLAVYSTLGHKEFRCLCLNLILWPSVSECCSLGVLQNLYHFFVPFWPQFTRLVSHQWCPWIESSKCPYSQ